MDLVADLGYLFLGSRLKRLAERLQTDAARVHKELGVDAQPAELALMAALDRYGPLTISAAVEALGVSQPAVSRTATGLVDRGLLANGTDDADLRQRTLTLTRSGRALVTRAKGQAWPAITEAVAEMCAPLRGTLLEQIAALEERHRDRPLGERALAVAKRGSDTLAIREWSDDLAQAFHDINAAWIESMFTLEEKDREILLHPREAILDGGGVIVFVESAELGVVGTCALMKVAPGVFEVTKMGVLESARGRRAGELLLEAVLARASAMDIDTLFLLTNAKCVPAIRLYEKLGFVHDAEIMSRYGAEYARCNVAMRYPRM